MRPSYVWVCHACRRSNAAGTEGCVACGFPAVASAIEVDRALQGTPGDGAVAHGALVLGPWLKAGLGISIATCGVGALLLKFAWTSNLLVIGLLMGIVGGVLSYFILDYGKWNARDMERASSAQTDENQDRDSSR